VAAAPDAVAVTCGDVVLTYAALDAASDRLAGRLAARGAGPEAVVAVAMDRSAELIIALLALVKAGAAYLPVDPSYPAERVSVMLAQASPVLTLTGIDLPPGSADLVPARPLSPVYVMFTSGSTGVP
jgi:non-ribosomal peptide synthetase component F